MSLNPTPISFIVEGAPRALLVHLTDASAPDETADRLRGLCGDFAWAALGVSDWNGDLSPWPAQAAFAGAAFAGRGPDTLDALLGALPDLQARLPRPLPVCLGGYSLAGLFALWAAHASDAFAAAVAASPSVWLPGWDAWADARRPARIPFYLSLGLKEPKARNPMLAAVGDAIGREHARLEAAGCPCVLEWNPGGHFVDPEGRTARGFAWALSHMAGEDRALR